MSAAPQILSPRAAEWRRSFDATFAAPPPPPEPPRKALLLVRAGGELLAVKRDEMSGLVRSDRITLTPGRSPEYLGLAGLRGGLCPVWSLGGLMGHPPAPVTGCCWLILAQMPAEVPCAFAFEVFEKLILTREAAFATSAHHDMRAGLIQAMVPWASTLVPVVNLPALQAEIHKRKPSTPLRTSPP